MITGTNRMHFVLFCMQNRPSGPYLAAVNSSLVPVMHVVYLWFRVFLGFRAWGLRRAPLSPSAFTMLGLTLYSICTYNVPKTHRAACFPWLCFTVLFYH
jgi:hypothetical protein